MINRLSIRNFKCFQNVELSLKPFTVLCGINSGGKSSIIQALLLGIESLEKGRKNGNLDLTGLHYNVDLYSFEEILYSDAEEEWIEIGIEEEQDKRVIKFLSEESDNNVKYTLTKGEGIREQAFKVWYLGSDRMISQYQRRGNVDALELGTNNEYIGFILEKGRSGKVMADRDRNCKDKDNVLFTTQVNEWLDYILPGNQVMAVTTGSDNLISLRFGKEQRLHKTNVGYGISFVLPILVSGLLAKKGDILIIENPELHLHPKAQSDLMLFLSCMAKAGVQIIIETHSDHVINGIRKAVVNPACKLAAKDTAIYFLGEQQMCRHIKIEADAELSEWPNDFMEQEENDLYFIRKMRMEHDIKHTNEYT